MCGKYFVLPLPACAAGRRDCSGCHLSLAATFTAGGVRRPDFRVQHRKECAKATGDEEQEVEDQDRFPRPAP